VATTINAAIVKKANTASVTSLNILAPLWLCAGLALLHCPNSQKTHHSQ